MFDTLNKNCTKKYQIKTTMNQVLKASDYDMYQGINNKKHANNREALITRLFYYEDEVFNQKKIAEIEDLEIEMDILTCSVDTKYHNFLREFKRVNEIGFVPKNKIFNLIKADANYQIVAEKLMTGLMETKEKLTELVKAGYLFNYLTLNQLINNKQYQDLEQLIIDCQLWIYVLEHDLLFDDESDYYFTSDDHWNRNLDAVTKIHYLQSDFMFNEASLSLISKAVLTDLIKSWKFSKFNNLKAIILNLININ